MKIEKSLPPKSIWERVKNAGMTPNEQTVLFTYGDTLYNPGGQLIPDYLIEHEETHCKQQGDNPDLWWERYLTEPYFRLSQETEAYANQYDFLCRVIKDKNQQFRLLLEISKTLASPLYGNLIDRSIARKMIKEKSKNG